MNCEQAETLLAAYVFGEVESPVADELREHVDRCETCAAVLRDMRAAAGLLEEALAGAPAPALTAERQKKLDGLKWPKKRDWSWLWRPIQVFGRRAAIPTFWRPIHAFWQRAAIPTFWRPIHAFWQRAAIPTFWRPPFWRPLATVGVGLCVVALLAGLSLSTVGTARDEARKVRSASNLKQIGTATELWLNKHGDQEAYPPSLEALAQDGIIQEERVFLDPKLATKQKRGEFTSDYESILGRAGGQLKESAVDPSTPLAWEKKPGSRGRNVVFFDGSVKHMPEERFQKLMKDTNSRLSGLAAGDKRGAPRAGPAKTADTPLHATAARTDPRRLDLVVDESSSMTIKANGTFARGSGTNWGEVAARNRAEVALNGSRVADHSYGYNKFIASDNYGVGTVGGGSNMGGPRAKPGGVASGLGPRKDAEKNGGARYKPKPARESEARLSDEKKVADALAWLDNKSTKGGKKYGSERTRGDLISTGEAFDAPARAGLEKDDEIAADMERYKKEKKLNVADTWRATRKGAIPYSGRWEDSAAAEGREKERKSIATGRDSDGDRLGRGEAESKLRPPGEANERDRARENGRKAGEPPVVAAQPGKASGPESRRPGDGEPEGGDAAEGWRGKAREPGLSADKAAPPPPEGVATGAAPKTAPPSPLKPEAKPKPDEAMKNAPARKPVRRSGGGGGGGKGIYYSLRRYDRDEIIVEKYKDKLKLKVPDATLRKLEKSLKAANGKESAGAQRAAQQAAEAAQLAVQAAQKAAQQAVQSGSGQQQAAQASMQAAQAAQQAAQAAQQAAQQAAATALKGTATELDRLDRQIRASREKIDRYHEQLKDMPQKAVQVVDGAEDVPLKRNKALEKLQERKIESEAQVDLLLEKRRQLQARIAGLQEKTRALPALEKEVARLNKLAADLVARGRNAEAAKVLESALEKYGGAVGRDALTLNAGLLAHRMGDLEKARQHYERVLKQYPKSPLANNAKKALALCRQQTQTDQAKPTPKPPRVRVNPFVLTKLDNKSTFALEADTGSYTVTRSYIRRGKLPPKHVVRVEEFVNAFDYNYAGNMSNVFAIRTTCARSPFRDELFQLKIGVKAKRVGRDGQRRNNIVICLDSSGSMGTRERLPLAQKASRMLVDNLAPADQVTVVTYGTQARLALDATPVKGNRKKINDAITSLQTSGSTNAAQGLAVAYLQAHKTFRSGDNNIVLIISDGIANVGPDDAKDILRNVKNDRRQGISLTSVGVGTGQYNDRLMEQLANNGDGRYVFIDTEREAERVFVDEIAKMQMVAKDAKIQVEFDPGVVRRYRLLGYENRDIADDKFRDDTVDAGEIGSGQSATALYELELLKAKGRIGVVRVRYKDIATGKIEEIESEIRADDVLKRSQTPPPRHRLAACAAQFAEILRGSPYADVRSVEQVERVLAQVCAELPLDNRAAELLGLVRATKTMLLGR